MIQSGGQSNMEKIIHRIFFNFNNEPDPFASYLESWKRELPDFTIMEWNARNLPLELNEYTRTLAKEKNHAFLSDYFRCWLLQQYGGVYLDADIEILDGDIFRRIYTEAQSDGDHDLFIGVESSRTGGLTPHSMGLACGARHGLLDFLMNLYETSLAGPLHHFLRRLPIPDLVRLYFIELEKTTGEQVSKDGLFFTVTDPVVLDRIKIYPQDYFSPLTERNSRKVIMSFSDNTCLCHHFAATWKQGDAGEKRAKTLEQALCDGDYHLAPDMKKAVFRKIPSLAGRRLKRPQWKLQNKQLKTVERILNTLIPYQSLLFKILSRNKNDL